MKTLNSKFLILNSQAAPVFAAWWWGGDARGEWTVDGGWRVLDLPTMRGFGIVMWEPTFRGSPDLEGIGVENFPMTFTALLDGCRTNGATYHWSSPDERVNILSPFARTTEVEIDSSMGGGDLELSVEAYTQGRNYYSTLWYHFPTNAGPRFSLAMPDTVFVNNDDDNDDGVLDCDRRFASGITNRDDDVAFATVTLPSGESRRGTLELYDRDGFIGTFFDAAIKGDYVGQGSEWEMSDSSSDALSLEANGSLPSDGYRSPMVKFRWTPDNGDEQTLCHRFTVVEPVVEPICSNTIVVVENGISRKLTLNPCGVGIGRDAYFRIVVKPEDYPDSKIEWQADGEGTVSFVGGNTGREVCVRGVSDGDLTLSVDIGGCTAAKPSFPLRVVENVQVKLSVWIVENDKGERARTEGEVRDMVKEANDVFAQVGMSFYIDSITVTNINEAYKVRYHGGAIEGSWSFDQVANIASGTGGVECYFIGSFSDAPNVLAANDKSGMLLTSRANGTTLAHEIGHTCGLKDIRKDEGPEAVSVSETFEWRHAMEDWNGGSCGRQTVGSRYYNHNTKLREIIDRLLMLGVRNEENDQARDISTGAVEGVYKYGDTDDDSMRMSVTTGIFRGNMTTRHPMHQ